MGRWAEVPAKPEAPELPAEFWVKQFVHGVRYYTFQRGFMTMEDGLDFMRKYLPNRVEEARAAWTNSIPQKVS